MYSFFFLLTALSIGSGLVIGRYSKSNDSDSDSGAKKCDRDILNNYIIKILFHTLGYTCKGK